MPRARFNKLPPERQAAILDPAAEEFAAHGYKGASLNRIIERSGTSKASMYYYFEDKEDLYATALARMAAGFYGHIGEMEFQSDCETFWEQARALSVRSMEYYAEDPTSAGLLRSLLDAQLTGECRTAVMQMRAAVQGWWAHALEVGQECGAVRTDLPSSLMIRLLVAMCDAADLWCTERIARLSADDLREMAIMLTDSLRKIGASDEADEARRHVWDRFRDD